MNVLVVDDETKIADVLTERLRLRGFEATPVYDATSAISMLKKHAYEGIILDLRLPDMDGTEVLKHVKSVYPGIRVVILSGHANEDDFQTCLELGASKCFHKPGDIHKLIQVFADGDESTE